MADDFRCWFVFGFWGFFWELPEFIKAVAGREISGAAFSMKPGGVLPFLPRPLSAAEKDYTLPPQSSKILAPSLGRL